MTSSNARSCGDQWCNLSSVVQVSAYSEQLGGNDIGHSTGVMQRGMVKFEDGFVALCKVEQQLLDELQEGGALS